MVVSVKLGTFLILFWDNACPPVPEAAPLKLRDSLASGDNDIESIGCNFTAADIAVVFGAAEAETSLVWAMGDEVVGSTDCDTGTSADMLRHNTHSTHRCNVQL